MKYKTLVCMNIAVIGNGRLSAGLALGLAAAGHDVWVAGNERAAQFVANIPCIHVTDAEIARDAAEVIILTSSTSQLREEVYYLDDVRDKIIIDATHLDSETTGSINTISVIKTISGATDIAKVFFTSGFQNLTTGNKEDGTNMLIAGDSRKAKELGKLLGRDLGFKYCQDMGGSDGVQLMDEMARCFQKLSATREKQNKAGIRVRISK
jgi:predicted dinucleotide-binding enzyme